MQRSFWPLPALQAFKPDMIIVACGRDADNFDPLSRMTAHSGTFGCLTETTMQVAQDLWGGPLVCAHEVVRTLAGVQSEVVDPSCAVAEANQPLADFVAFQRQR